MKNLIRLKQLDLWLQQLAFLVALVVVLFDREQWYIAYFTVGSAQLLSFIAHLFATGFHFGSGRKWYSVALGIFALMLVPPLTMAGLFALLFLSPVVAIWYLVLCSRELEELRFSNEFRFGS